MNIVITGVSKGIGLSLTKVALNAGHIVCGVARRPEASSELMELKRSFPQLKIIQLDLQDKDAIEKLESEGKSMGILDLVINNAGVYEEGDSREAFHKSFEINSIIPYLISKSFIPMLKKAPHPKLIHITSAMGSIVENTSGGAYAYRASKTALNMLNRCLTVENDWLTTAVIHPGWVQTEMGGTSAPVKPSESSEGIWRVIENLKNSDSGSFKDYQGRDLPW